MWRIENRARYNRDKLRHPSDLTDKEWGYIAELIAPAKRGGHKREVDERDVLNGIMQVLSTGCQWRYAPKDFPSKSTLHRYFDLWEWGDTLEHFPY